MVGLAGVVRGAADALTISADSIVAIRIASALNALVVLADGTGGIGAVVVPVASRSVTSATVSADVACQVAVLSIRAAPIVTAAGTLTILANTLPAVIIRGTLNALMALADGLVAVGAIVVPVASRSVGSATGSTLVVLEVTVLRVLTLPVLGATGANVVSANAFPAVTIGSTLNTLMASANFHTSTIVVIVTCGSVTSATRSADAGITVFRDSAVVIERASLASIGIVASLALEVVAELSLHAIFIIAANGALVVLTSLTVAVISVSALNAVSSVAERSNRRANGIDVSIRGGTLSNRVDVRSSGRSDGHAQQGAGTSTVVVIIGGDEDVAVDTPVLAPGVSDHDGILTHEGSISDGDDGVVDVSTAFEGLVDNTSGVVHNGS